MSKLVNHDRVDDMIEGVIADRRLGRDFVTPEDDQTSRMIGFRVSGEGREDSVHRIALMKVKMRRGIPQDLEALMRSSGGRAAIAAGISHGHHPKETAGCKACLVEQVMTA